MQFCCLFLSAILILYKNSPTKVTKKLDKILHQQWLRALLMKEDGENKKCRIYHPLWARCVRWTEILFATILKSKCLLKLNYMIDWSISSTGLCYINAGERGREARWEANESKTWLKTCSPIFIFENFSTIFIFENF